jgi:hypothetical protein
MRCRGLKDILASSQLASGYSIPSFTSALKNFAKPIAESGRKVSFVEVADACKKLIVP